MRRTRIPKYLQFDHVIDLSVKDFNSMEGKEHFHYIYCGQRTFKEGEWICFQCLNQQADFELSNKLIRQVKTLIFQTPLYGMDDCVELILFAEHYDLYRNEQYRTEHFINEGSAIKLT